MKAHEERVSMAVSGYYATPGIWWSWATSSGRPFQYFACGAAVAEVEVDGYNGMHRVLKIDVVHDVGNSLNPGVDLGQLEGGLVQGIGWLTREELLWNKEGRMLTHSASTYQIPAINDPREQGLRRAAAHAGLRGPRGPTGCSRCIWFQAGRGRPGISRHRRGDLCRDPGTVDRRSRMTANALCKHPINRFLSRFVDDLTG